MTLHGTIAAGFMKSKVDWDVIENTSKICKIKIWYKDAPERIAEIEYRIEEAAHAGLLSKDNWIKYPQDMLFYKCLARARKRFCPELLGGVAIFEDYQGVVDTKGAEVVDGQESNPLLESIQQAESIADLEKLKIEISKSKDSSLVTAYSRKKIEIEKQTPPLSEPPTNENAQTNTTNIPKQDASVGQLPLGA